MNILVLCDDLWHPGEVVERGLRPLAKLGYELDFVKAPKDILTHEMLRRYDAIINARGAGHTPANASQPWFEPNVTAVMPKDFREYVEEGHGFIALHSGNAYQSETLPDMTNLTGNDFLGHPPQCKVTAKPVGAHPIIEGVGEFSFVDEHYIIDLHATDADIFLETTSDTDAGTQPAGYTRTMGKGRFCCLTPGHNCAVIESEPFIKLLDNALKWCTGRL